MTVKQTQLNPQHSIMGLYSYNLNQSTKTLIKNKMLIFKCKCKKITINLITFCMR
jgi:hypothetical protein